MPIIQPHAVTSRLVRSPQDIERIRKDVPEMLSFCWTTDKEPVPIAYAIAHSQITSEDPLTFFVTHDGVIVVNPVIIKSTRHTVPRKEGCMSFLTRHKQFKVDRYNKVTVQFQVLTEEGLSPLQTENLDSLLAQVFQHEMDHFNAKYVFNYE